MPSYKFYIKVGGTDWPSGWYDSYFTNGSDNLLADGEWHQFYPGVNRDMAIEYDIWDNKYRRKLNGELWFFNNKIQSDYTTLSQIDNQSAQINLRVEFNCDTTTSSDWWEGYFSIIDGKWDSDRGTLQVSATPDDEYRLLEEFGDRKYNLYDLSPAESVMISNSGDPYEFWSECTSLTEQGYKDEHAPPFGDWADWTLRDTYICELYNYIYVWQSVALPDADFGNGRGLFLKEAIEYIVTNNYAPAYKSTFFENDTLPGGASGGTANYVTNTTPNPLNDMILIRKSNVRPTTNPATKWLIAFNELMETLKNTFNVDWFVDSDGNFRIEHVSYFDTTSASDVDLRVLDGGKWINGKNKWEYDIAEMPNREHFEFQDSANIDFIGKDIVYSNLATFNRYKDNIKDRIVPLSTDAKNLYEIRTAIEEEGWVLVTQASGVILNEVGELSAASLPNNHLSWANLHHNYWMHDRVILTGNMNGVDTTFTTAQRNIKQTEIVYPECCDAFDPIATKITDLGEGKVHEASFRLIDGSVKTVFFFS